MKQNYLHVNRELLEEFNINGSHRNNRVIRTPESWIRIKNKPTNVTEDEIDERSIPEGYRYFRVEISSQAGGYADEKLEKLMEKGARPVKKITHAPQLYNLTDDEKNLMAELKSPEGGFNKDPYRHFMKEHGLLMMSIPCEIFTAHENRNNANAWKSYENLSEEGFNSQPQPYNMYKEVNRNDTPKSFQSNNQSGRRNQINEDFHQVESPFRKMNYN